ncbi:hypothetical protein VTJ83DRAFT_3540 [Remersonia thermophila]|uniref:GDP/GTP exchange factor Sec2 N-terminal domain-containing protein n=1 Tax=Remersonia thermophila TaxID=72144 RepID=A0ABR4DGK1_9PEZI
MSATAIMTVAHPGTLTTSTATLTTTAAAAAAAATTTTTTTTATTTTATTTTATTMTGSQSIACCPKCGYGAELPLFEETQAALLKAQQRISNLEAQVRLLNQKATAAVDRWADYEDELTRLRAELDSRPQTPAGPPPPPLSSLPSLPSLSPSAPPAALASPPAPSFLTTGAAARISALLSRKPASPAPAPLKPAPTSVPSGQLSPIPSLPSSAVFPPPSAGSHPTPPPSLPSSAQLTTEDLLAALSREQALRQEAEGKLSQTSREVEELSVSLFEQANEMVAAERRARAKLEARVGELERREGDKRRRLERLEQAVARIERVRGVLQEGERPASKEGDEK